MHTFSYTARDQAGKSIAGVIEAVSQPEALVRLQREGKVVTEIRLGANDLQLDQLTIDHSANNVGREEVITVANQLGIMLETGVPLADALDATIEQASSAHTRRILGAVASDVTSGVPLSDALAEFPRVFPPIMVTLIRASEASGAMAEMLLRVGEYLRSDRKTARQVRGALTYPCVMLTLSFVVSSFLIVWVLPRFAKIYESREAALPTLTRVLLDASTFIGTNWVAIALGFLIGAALLLQVRTTRFGRLAIDTLKIRTPVLGSIFNQLYLTRATRTLGTLLHAGVPILDAVRIVRGATDNRHWHLLWNECEAAMTAGRPISSALIESDLVPTSMGQMVAASERTGKLAEVLDRVGVDAEHQLDENIKDATQLIEPAMILVMGAVIGSVAIALLLPIFTISNVISR